MFTAALVLLLVAVAYFAVTTLIDLYPLNNVRAASRRERTIEVAVNGPIMLAPAVLLVVGRGTGLAVLGYLGGVIEALVVVGGLALWWLPYLVGRTVPWATAGTGGSWSELHARTYAHTLIVLPPLRGRPRPNVEHLLLHGLLLVAAVATFLAAGGL